MGFSTYFLIVWDFIQYARREKIPVGPGRGSGAGSLVAYALAITSVDPIAHGLLFERFLNPDRRTMPDLDIDFSDEGREHVIEYVRHKYGENCVCQIITFGSMLARLVVRDVGRVLDMPLVEVDRIARMIPHELGITIHGAIQAVPELKEAYRTDPQIKKLLELAQRLEGLKRHTGVHAAGTVISPGDITEFVPLSRGTRDVVTTQFNDESLLKLGLLKIDFLGLRTLTVIRNASDLVRQRHQEGFRHRKDSDGKPRHFQASGRGQDGGGVPVGIDRYARSHAQAQGPPVSPISWLHRPLPPGSHAFRHVGRLCRPQARQIQGSL